MNRLIRWLKDWAALAAIIPVIVGGLLTAGEVNAITRRNTVGIERVEDTLRSALRDFRVENREDHARILDLIEKLRDHMEAK